MTRTATQIRHQAADTWSALNHETDPAEISRLTRRLLSLMAQYRQLTAKQLEFS